MVAPAQTHFVGVLNSGDDDINGRLVHDAVMGSFPAGTKFTVTVYGNRGRLAAAPSATFPANPSELTLQFFGFTTGAVPVVDPSNDNWNRTPKVLLSRVFTNWGSNGNWRSQTFQFVTPQALAYISLSVTGKNHNSASYVAFDIAAP